MAINQYDAYKGFHDFARATVEIYHLNKLMAAQFNVDKPRGHHAASRCGWYWGAYDSVFGGPFSSSRKAYQAARAKFHDTDKGS